MHEHKFITEDNGSQKSVWGWHWQLDLLLFVYWNHANYATVLGHSYITKHEIADEMTPSAGTQGQDKLIQVGQQCRVRGLQWLAMHMLLPLNSPKVRHMTHWQRNHHLTTSHRRLVSRHFTKLLTQSWLSGRACESANLPAVKLSLLCTPPWFDVHDRGDSVQISRWTLPHRKLGWWGYPKVKTSWS